MKKLILVAAIANVCVANAQTVKKVMLEDFTGTWCQYCPNGTKAIKDLETTHGDKFLAVATHNANGDPLEIADGKAIVTGLSVTGYPNGAIDRKVLSGGKIPMGINATGQQWKDGVTTRLAVPAIVSVGFANLKKKTDGSYEGDLVIKFSSAPEAGTPIKANIYLLENKIEATASNGLGQKNVTQWYGGPGAPPQITTYSAGTGFLHDHTLRAAVGGAWGWADAVPATPVVGTEYKKHFTFSLPASGVPGPWKPENMEVVGFIAYDGAAASDKKSVMNAERVPLSMFFQTGIEEGVNNVSIASTYPNPASASEVVNVIYSTNKSEKVTMKVYNAIGQVVAQPYTSDDVAGSHTILWVPAKDNLVPGLYFIEVSSASGSVKERITIL